MELMTRGDLKSHLRSLRPEAEVGTRKLLGGGAGELERTWAVEGIILMQENLNCIPGKRYSPGAEKEGLSQAMEALNRCPGRLDSTLLKQE